MLVMDTEQSFANNIVAEAFDRGINYFDVAPNTETRSKGWAGPGALPAALFPGLQDADAR